jgi:NAD(P)-dependent dehydrogenase (short-subunit alcohol dehydrogenase family)
MQQNKKVVVVTGANKGIGFELARQLGQKGMAVLLGARNPKLGEEAANRLSSEGLEVHFLKIDLTDHATAKSAADHIETSYGRLDVLVNNAGITWLGDGLPSVRPLRRSSALSKRMSSERSRSRRPCCH